MRAVEFKSKPHDNVVDLPPGLREWNGRRVRVILLSDEGSELHGEPVFNAISLKTRGFKFDRDDANAR
jgi:hypothetical protein